MAPRHRRRWSDFLSRASHTSGLNIMAPCQRRRRRRSSHCRRWSDFPPEILDLVLQKLDLPDCFSFGKVCTSWRSILLHRYSRPPPCMLLLHKEDTGMTSARLLCKPLHHGGNGNLPSSIMLPGFRVSEQVVGCSMGWLVIASDNRSSSRRIYLLNPITKQRINLPSTATGGIEMKLLAFGDTCFTIQHVDLSSAPTSGNNDCILIARGVYGRQGDNVFAWCRPGDREWTTFIGFDNDDKKEEEDEWAELETVFHEGNLYVLNQQGDVWVYAFDDQRAKMTRSFKPHFLPICILPGDLTQLVISGEELLLVLCQYDDDITHDIQVFRPEENPDRWVKVESLDDRVLLIGTRGAESFDPQDNNPGFEANCIYYESQNGPQYLSKFSITDGSNQDMPLPIEADFDGYHRIAIEWIAAQSW